MHAHHRVVAARVVRPYLLEVEFDDHVRVRIDLEGVLYGETYGPLREPEVFAMVAVDPDAHTVTWPNGADFDPETLHDWDSHKAELMKLAETWRTGARVRVNVATTVRT